MMRIDLIQDVATPHNNQLIAALRASAVGEVQLWYALSSSSEYGWGNSITNQLEGAKIYGRNRVSWGLLWVLITNRTRKVFLVGWMNPTTRLLVPLFCLLRRPYNMWFDLPNDGAQRSLLRRSFREFYYRLLRLSKVRIYCCGGVVVEYFKARHFKEESLCNFPILSPFQNNVPVRASERNAIRAKYGVSDRTAFIVSGSRLIFEKGFDLLITAFGKLAERERNAIKVLIIGQGAEKPRLVDLAQTLQLSANVIFEDWLPPADFADCIKSADFFAQPSRFDAYGGATSAISLGVPVIGTRQSGACRELIEHGRNGFLYEASNTDELSRLLVEASRLAGTSQYVEMAKAALYTGSHWTPARAAQTLWNTVI